MARIGLSSACLLADVVTFATRESATALVALTAVTFVIGAVSLVPEINRVVERLMAVRDGD